VIRRSSTTWLLPGGLVSNKASDGRTAQSDIRMAISMNRQLG